ncbi:MAG TPA: carbohydrate ABC transporter permease [Thermoflexia bacterium]|jgi:multiple sugar transport system permease protein|nr:carbohydrate ABC transporter permease [Thermoflexia bacterium]
MLLPAERKWYHQAATYALLIGGLVIVAVPFIYMVSTSLKPQQYTFEYPPRLLPSEVTLNNYVQALSKDLFFLYFLNSLVVAVATTAATVLISSLLAYAFSRLEFPGREPLFYLLLLGMMIPPVTLIIPQFLVAKTFRLLNSYAGLVVVYVTMNLSMQTFLLRGFFESIPSELEDAVRIDGGSQWTMFWHIILPLSRPGLATVAIFTFLYSWDEFPWAHVAIKETTRRTLPIAIALFQNQHLTQWGQVFAASVVALLPVIAVFVLFQRYFIRGIARSGLKG